METNSGNSPTSQPYYELHLSLRYLKSRFSAVAALLSVTFGVAIIIIVLSIMGGYIEALKESIRGQESHIMVMGAPFSLKNIVEVENLLESVENVEATSPFIEILAMYKSGQFNPCNLRAIQPRKETRVSSIGEYVLRPAELEAILEKLATDSPARDPSPGGVPLQPTRLIDEVLHAPQREALSAQELENFFEDDFGRELLEKRNSSILPALEGTIPPAAIVGIHMLLDRQMFLGQVITIATIKPESSEPKEEMFLVAGAFKTGDYDADSKALYMHIDTLKNVLDLFDPEANSYGYSGIRIKVKDLSRLEETIEEIQKVFLQERSDLSVLSWEKLRGTLLAAVKIEKFVIYFLLVLLMSFTGLMVLLMLLLTVIEKTRDMGVLLALGATPGGVTRIFLTGGLITCIAGTVLGLFLGYLFCWNINMIHDWVFALTGRELFAARIYHMDRIPISFQLGDVLLSIAPPVVLGFLASLVPAIWASRRDPIKAIHYE